MKRKILVIHNGYPLRGDGGDKVRTLNMLQSLDSIGFDVCLLAFFKKETTLVICEENVLNDCSILCSSPISA